MLEVQRRLAAQILKCGQNRIRFDPNQLDDIKEAITKADIRSLINNDVITRKKVRATSNFWIKKRKEQKKYGRQKGFGSRKGKKTARLNPKRTWINKIRLQRVFIKNLRNENTVSSTNYKELYAKSKGGFFRSIRHLKLYIKEKGILQNEKK